MPHPLVLALFDNAVAAANAARGVRGLGVPRERVSIVARSHDEEGQLGQVSGGSPGSEIEDSAPASRLGELGGHLIAAIAMVMPGIGPIVADGPLAAGLGEAAGLSRAEAEAWDRHPPRVVSDRRTRHRGLGRGGAKGDDGRGSRPGRRRNMAGVSPVAG